MNARGAVAIARADFLERVRRDAFLVTLAVTLWLAWAIGSGLINVALGSIRGVFNSAWTGTAVAIIATTMASLPGFYLVKNTIARDRATGVGAILAATPMSRATYALGKLLSNAAVLCTLLGVLALAAAAIQLSRGEVTRIEPWTLLAPFVLIGVPTLFVTAAFAFAFECVPLLRGATGNVAWLFVWVLLLNTSIQPAESPEWRGVDVFGIGGVARSMKAEAGAKFSDYSGDFAIGRVGGALTRTFVWSGVKWTPGAIAGRFAVVLGAALLALLAALAFDRFDHAPRPSRAPARAAPSAELEWHAAPLAPLAPGARRFDLAALALGELRLLAASASWWWWLVAAGLALAGWLAPLSAAWAGVLAAAWIWPLPHWSALGTRESENGTSELFDSAPGAILRQLPAAWIAGALLAIALGSGVGARLALAGRFLDFSAWLGGALFVPALALACGTWSGTRRAFEGLYVAMWYIGALQHVAVLDYPGAGRLTGAGPGPFTYLIVTAALLPLAALGRAKRLAR